MLPGLAAGLDCATIPSLRAAFRAGELTVTALVEAFLDRIERLDPELRTVLARRPDALRDARDADRRWRAGQPCGPLDGIPVLVKDNIAVSGLPTTVGSRALADSAPPDAALVRRLRAAGAIIIGKANLSEWANFRSTRSTSGWSAIGGQCRNPHALDRTPSGSSSGSAAAVAASLTQVAIGSETDGSITAPASACGVVGFKPTHGSVPGEGIVPISSAQDVAGPITRHVIDAAIVFSVLAGAVVDDTAPFGVAATGPGRPGDARHGGPLAGARLGVWRPAGSDAAIDVVFDATLAALAAGGAELIDIPIDIAAVAAHEMPALLTEFHHELDAYLAAAPGGGPRDMAALVAFNQADDLELARFGQEQFEAALAAPPIDDPGYLRHRATATALARAALDEPMDAHGLDAIITVTASPAGVIDYALGDDGQIETTTAAAVAGNPAISLPAGFVTAPTGAASPAGPLPIGVTLIGRRGGDMALLRLASALEQIHPARRAPTQF
ncbi:MAG: amidase family protein [Actinomycetia bacterium]|nr:amidase family protein [Actinomycetes bacterium]